MLVKYSNPRLWAENLDGDENVFDEVRMTQKV